MFKQLNNVTILILPHVETFPNKVRSGDNKNDFVHEEIQLSH